MKINATLVTNGPMNWPKVTPKLFDADGEVRVGDVVRFNNKPCFVERIAELVTLTTMDTWQLLVTSHSSTNKTILLHSATIIACM
jgi:hypothetical protein